MTMKVVLAVVVAVMAFERAGVRVRGFGEVWLPIFAMGQGVCSQQLIVVRFCDEISVIRVRRFAIALSAAPSHTATIARPTPARRLQGETSDPSAQRSSARTPRGSDHHPSRTSRDFVSLVRQTKLPRDEADLRAPIPGNRRICRFDASTKSAATLFPSRSFILLVHVEEKARRGPRGFSEGSPLARRRRV